MGLSSEQTVKPETQLNTAAAPTDSGLTTPESQPQTLGLLSSHLPSDVDPPKKSRFQVSRVTEESSTSTMSADVDTSDPEAAQLVVEDNDPALKELLDKQEHERKALALQHQKELTSFYACRIQHIQQQHQQQQQQQQQQKQLQKQQQQQQQQQQDQL